MCRECGCDSGGGVMVENHSSQPHTHLPRTGSRLIALGRSLLENNAQWAECNRALFSSKKLLVLNVVSSPGTGKTTLIHQTAIQLAHRVRMAVIVGDLATDNDAARLRTAGIPVVQITTGTLCHLEGQMISKAASALDLDQLDLLVIENVGNLVCPADFDLGENLRVVLLSVTEGEDKPLKYPPMFHSAHVAVVTKIDLSDATEFNREQALANLRGISHHAEIIELSAKTGKGMDRWINLLLERRAEILRSEPCKSQPTGQSFRWLREFLA